MRVVYQDEIHRTNLKKEIIMVLGDEFSFIDFQSMIGGPLNAVIKAQAQSAQTSVGLNAVDNEYMHNAIIPKFNGVLK